MSEDIFGQDEPVEDGSGIEFVEEGSGDEPVEEGSEEEEAAMLLASGVNDSRGKAFLRGGLREAGGVRVGCVA